MAHDPSYLDLLRQFIIEDNRKRKFELYEKLAALTVVPVGELWQEGMTVLGVESKTAPPELMEETLKFWEKLLSNE